MVRRIPLILKGPSMATSKETVVQTQTVTPMNQVDQSAIELMVSQMVAAKLAEQVERSSTSPIVDATHRDAKVARPKNYLEHYRNDVSPDIEIQMRPINDDGTVGSGVLRGRKIRFRRGHFFATKQDEVDFLNWIMSTPVSDPSDPTKILGGQPYIYVSDGKELVACAYCDEPFVAGSNALKSHLRATHGIT